MGQLKEELERIEGDVEEHVDELSHSENARSPRANIVIRTLLILSVALSVLQGVTQGIFSAEWLAGLTAGAVTPQAIVTIVYFVLVLVILGLLVFVIRADFKHRITAARMAIRVLIVLLIVAILLNLALDGVTWLSMAYVAQFILIIAYQVYNDPNLARPLHFSNPFKREKTDDPDAERKKYIPLDFFNLFWIFMVASVVGLGVEMIFCLLVNGVWEDRAGLLWGPFSPIYGVGAVLMTLALNRVWNRNAIVILVIAGLIGAAFEFFVSWYMEVAFGVLAWDYSGSFLNIDGRTDFAHAIAWGFLGLVYMRILLPVIMRVVTVIPLKWRALITVIAFVGMLFNGFMTLTALDCWSQRTAGQPVSTPTQEYCAEHFDDEFMQTRFSTMGMSQESALRAQQH